MTESKNDYLRRRYRYYEILEINKEANQEEIKAAYKKLAKKWHPDINDAPEAHKKIIKINQAYEVLSNPLRRVEYDSSPAECPRCWTYEVEQTVESSWKCRRCYYQFDSAITTEVIEEIEKAAISERQKKYMRLFQTTQCSWCKKFYTQPFLCPNEFLKSNCVTFERLTEKEREVLLRDDMWWWRMQDMIMRAGERGILCRCRKCFALNPNPNTQKRTCWHCGGDTLECPARLKDSTICRTLLRYDIEGNYWKCISAGCSRTYKYITKEPLKLPQEVWDDINEQLRIQRRKKQEEEKSRVSIKWAQQQETRTAHIRQDEDIRHKQQTADELRQKEEEKRRASIKWAQQHESRTAIRKQAEDQKHGHKKSETLIPTCPICKSDTTLLTAKKGKEAGKQFYVCIKYPKCKGRIPVRKKAL